MTECQDCGIARSDKRPDGWARGRCRNCYLKWYAQTPVGAAKREEHKKKLYAEALAVEAELKALGCTDCGELDTVVLQFDHLPEYEKSGAVASQRHSPGRHRKELMKCEVVCANCHVRRTYARGQWTQGRGGDNDVCS